MILFPSCKINIGLRITKKRDDGYHDLYTLFYPIPSCRDCIEITTSHSFRINSYQNTEPILQKNNLIYKAWKLYADLYQISTVEIGYKKYIPSGAGLGGGSADAAFTLMALNDLFQLKLEPSTIAVHALQLGSDVPYFIYNRPLIASGRGELFEETSFHLKNKKILLIKPPHKIPTAEAFQNIEPHLQNLRYDELFKKDLSSWKYYLKNDFEEYAITKIPAIALIKNKMYESQALLAMMSGSGSTVFGIFNEEADCTELKDWAFKNKFFIHEHITS